MGIKVGLIGMGMIAEQHLLAYAVNKNIEAVYIAEPIEALRNNAQKKYPIIKKVFSNYADMLKEDFDTVDICTPHCMHYQTTLDSFKAGKHVICEKPIAMNLQEADEMIAASKKSGKRLFISMNQRFMPNHQEAKKLIESGAIGKPFLAIFNLMGDEYDRMADPTTWKCSWEKAGGGAMIDTGYHALYVIISLLGKVKAVTGVTKRLIVEAENKADDNSVAILEFENGAIGNIAVSYTVRSDMWSEKRHVYGTQGSLHMQDTCIESITMTKDKQETKVVEVCHPTDIGPFTYSIKRALDHFIDCLVNNKEPQVTAEEARYTLKIALAIYESSKQGKKVFIDNN